MSSQFFLYFESLFFIILGSCEGSVGCYANDQWNVFEHVHYRMFYETFFAKFCGNGLLDVLSDTFQCCDLPVSYTYLTLPTSELV